MEASTGASADGTAPASDLPPGWSRLLPAPPDIAPLVTNEQLVAHTLSESGFLIRQAGSRYESFDLEIVQDPAGELAPGRYEVKTLSRSGSSFDRRFKVGSRSERIYGRRDAEIKAAAMEAEDLMESPGWYYQLSVVDVDELHRTIDMALARRHGKKFDESFTHALTAITRVRLPLGMPYRMIDKFIKGSVTNRNIAEGFSDIAGIFIVAGANYTLVKAGELTRFISFDSVSAEGVKLRYNGRVPQAEVVQSEAGRKAKGNKAKVENKR